MKYEDVRINSKYVINYPDQRKCKICTALELRYIDKSCRVELLDGEIVSYKTVWLDER